VCVCVCALHTLSILKLPYVWLLSLCSLLGSQKSHQAFTLADVTLFMVTQTFHKPSVSDSKSCWSKFHNPETILATHRILCFRYHKLGEISDVCQPLQLSVLCHFPTFDTSKGTGHQNTDCLPPCWDITFTVINTLGWSADWTHSSSEQTVWAFPFIFPVVGFTYMLWKPCHSQPILILVHLN
jgi:hypothetical protein